ncbi:MAG: hypothetical protein JWP76_1756 [Dactylosporangium sp.]|nr:hypothetical protein [Dactylosporangium sp.]
MSESELTPLSAEEIAAEGATQSRLNRVRWWNQRDRAW